MTERKRRNKERDTLWPVVCCQYASNNWSSFKPKSGVWNSICVSYIESRNTSTWAIFHCSPSPRMAVQKQGTSETPQAVPTPTAPQHWPQYSCLEQQNNSRKLLHSRFAFFFSESIWGLITNSSVLLCFLTKKIIKIKIKNKKQNKQKKTCPLKSEIISF